MLGFNDLDTTFLTELSISEETFVEQFKKQIDAKSDSFSMNRVNPERFTGEITLGNFNIEKNYSFGRDQHSTIEVEGILTKEDDKLIIRSNLKTKSAFKNEFMIGYIILVFFMILFTSFLLILIYFKSDSVKDAISSYFTLFCLLTVFSFIRRNAKKRGLEKMKLELEKEFELIELRALKNKQ